MAIILCYFFVSASLTIQFVSMKRSDSRDLPNLNVIHFNISSFNQLSDFISSIITIKKSVIDIAVIIIRNYQFKALLNYYNLFEFIVIQVPIHSLI